MDIVNWLFFFVRVKSNFSYYQFVKGLEVEGILRVIDGWFDVMDGIKVEIVEEQRRLIVEDVEVYEDKEGDVEEVDVNFD